jgi:hypothetical protein
VSVAGEEALTRVPRREAPAAAGIVSTDKRDVGCCPCRGVRARPMRIYGVVETVARVLGFDGDAFISAKPVERLTTEL